TEAHGVKRYPFGRDVLVDLSCARRKSAVERPRVEATATAPLELELRWSGGSEVRALGRR
ncbi:MAG: hypothetical protein ACM3PV_02340, partial [Betaproteobacteria bacterium]